MSIEREAMSALRWATVAKAVAQLFSWAGTLLVVRLLAPSDYGIMAKVAVVCSISATISELGLGAAIVRWPNIARTDLRSISGISFLFSLSAYLVVVLSSPLLAEAFREPRLVWPIACASMQIIFGSFTIVPESLWIRELNFRPIAMITMATGFVSAATTLLLATLGFGVWALVLGNVIGSFSRAMSFVILGQYVRPAFSFGGISEQIKFGLTLVGGRLAYATVVQADVVIGSVFLSTTEIGYYALALQLATLPMIKVMGILNSIILPTVARQQKDNSKVRQTMLTSIRVLATVAFPTLWGISAVAHELVRVLFGKEWQPVERALTILPLVVPLRMVSVVVSSTSLALGNRKLEFRNTVTSLILLPGGFLAGSSWGLYGLSLSWLVSLPLAFMLTVPGMLKYVGVGLRSLVAELSPPMLAASAMFFVIYLLRPLLGDLHPVVMLAGLVIAGFLTSLAAIFSLSRRHLSETIQFVRSIAVERQR